MELEFDEVQASVAFSTKESSTRLCVGFLDGALHLYDFNPKDLSRRLLLEYRLKAAVRNVGICPSEENIYVTSRNRALCQIDVATSFRTRCIREAHSAKPSSFCLLSLENQQLATGDEDGKIKTWDLRASNPKVHSFEDQEDVIYQLVFDRLKLLAVSADGTLAVYDLRKGKMKTKSETMHGELLSLVANKKFSYAGSSEGILEIFRGGEYGNIVERFETGLSSVDSMVELRRGLLAVASGNEAGIRLLHVNPNKKLQLLGEHGGGVDMMVLSSDKKWLLSSSMADQTIKIWDVEKVRQKIPILTASAAKEKVKQNGNVSNDFWEDLADSD